VRDLAQPHWLLRSHLAKELCAPLADLPVEFSDGSRTCRSYSGSKLAIAWSARAPSSSSAADTAEMYCSAV
jgi:hypothetical protein